MNSHEDITTTRIRVMDEFTPGQNMKHRKWQRKGQKGHTTWESTPSADPIVNSFYGPMNEDKIMNEN